MKGTGSKTTTYKSIIFVLLAISFVFSGVDALQAQCGNSWGQVHYYQSSDVIRGIVNNGSIYVAVGDEGLVMTSTDGLNWTKRAYNRTNQFAGVYAEGKFVVVGADKYVVTSSNGTSWTQRSYAKGTEDLWDVAYGNGTFVAIGDGGIVYTSPDGVTWTKRNVGTTNRLMGITFGDGKFVATGTTQKFHVSTDGVSWTAYGSTFTNMICITYGAGKFVAGGRLGAVYTSSDAQNWTRVNIGLSNYLWGITYTPNGFVAVGNRGLRSTCMIITSTTGSSWTWRESYVTSELLGVDNNGTTVIAGGIGGAITTSKCGSSSPQIVVAEPTSGNEYNANSNQKIRWGSFGTVGAVKIEYSTNDGASWNTVTASTTNDGSHNWTVPNTPATQCKVRVSEASDSDPTDTSNSNFTIKGSTSNTIRFTTPNGGEEIAGGSQYTIRWTGSKTYDKIDLEYNNGTEWLVIASNLPDTRSYVWTVPNINTTKAELWIRGYASDGNPTDKTDATFTIKPGAEIPYITITSPNGGETIAGGSTFDITWTDNRTFDRIDIEYYDGTKWNVIVNDAQDDDHYLWTVPNVVTSEGQLWIKGYDTDNNPTDFSDADFTITSPPSGTITVTAPNGGEGLRPGGTTDITWTTTGTVGSNVKVAYSTDSGRNFTTIISSTANDGTYSWSVPNVVSDDCLVRVTDTSNSLISDVSDNYFSIGGDPEISLNKTQVNFGYLVGTRSPETQTVLISNNGSGSLSWTAGADVNWITVSPGSGNGDAVLSITINPDGLGAGTHNGTITVTASNAVNSPQTVAVQLVVKYPSQDQPPFGSFEVPDDGETGVSGAIPVTGWALDDIGVESVFIYRDVNGSLGLLGEAVFVEGARADVEQAFPTYPRNSRGGWGYMLLTNFLPEGELKLKVIAKDTTGHQVELGTKTVYLDHENAVLPFGAIDTPLQGGEASGNTYWNQGWVLTPNPNKIPEDGSTINVYVDGTFKGKATYNNPRKDIANFFPSYANTDGPGAYFGLDTTAYANGVYSISWGVVDSGGNKAGIGSRYFTIQNTSNRASADSTTAEPAPQGQLKVAQNFNKKAKMMSIDTLEQIPANYEEPFKVQTGFGTDFIPADMYPDANGHIHLNVPQMERIEIEVGPNVEAAYQLVGVETRALPIGSNLDTERGIFTWQLGAGFMGDHHLVFVKKAPNGQLMKTRLIVNITPKKLGNIDNHQLDNNQ